MQCVNILFLILIYQNLFAKDIFIPVPELPKVFNPAKAYDVFSINLNIQLHKRLFDLDDRQLPIPDLVKDFKIQNQGLEYIFTIKEKKFHNTDPLTADITVSSLKYSLNSGITGIERFKCIQGYKDKSFSGIVSLNKNTFKISLNCKDPRLIFHFSDVRLSIFNSKNPAVGLGDYKLKQVTSETVVITDVNEDKLNIVYMLDKDTKKIDSIIKSNQSMILYMTSKMHSIYEGNEKLLIKKPIQSLKNYNLHLNSRTIKSKEIRKSILSAIDRQVLADKCYGVQNLDNNFVPFGFVGHSKNATLPELILQKPKARVKIKIGVFSGVGNENCVKNVLNTAFSKNNIEGIVLQVDTSEGIEKFRNDELDGIFIYLEGEQNADMLEFYVDSPNLPLGNKNNKNVSSIYYKMKKAESQIELFKLGDTLRAEILNDYIVLPFFTPKEYVLHTKDLNLGSYGVYSPTFINLKHIRTNFE